MRPKFIVISVLVVLLLVVLVQNTQVITLKFFFWSLSMSQIILLVITLCLGFISGFIVSYLYKKR
jgi:uncharacterized integral membrane protein